MYEDVSAVAKVIIFPDRDRVLNRKINLRDGKRIRSTLIQYSISQAQPFRLDLQTFFPYLPMVLYPVGYTRGPTTRATKTLPKVFIFSNLPVGFCSGIANLVRRGIYSGYLGI